MSEQTSLPFEEIVLTTIPPEKRNRGYLYAKTGTIRVGSDVFATGHRIAKFIEPDDHDLFKDVFANMLARAYNNALAAATTAVLNHSKGGADTAQTIEIIQEISELRFAYTKPNDFVAESLKSPMENKADAIAASFHASHESMSQQKGDPLPEKPLSDDEIKDGIDTLSAFFGVKE